MKIQLKKIIIWIAAAIGLGIVGYIGFTIYVFFMLTSGCGMDDGPFNAMIVDHYELSDSIEIFEIDSGHLILDNRNDTLSPMIIIEENGEDKFIFDMDVRNTKGFKSYRIWEISNLSIVDGGQKIRLRFTGHWSYGAEAGYMEINRKNGKNNFCLSW